MVDDFDPGIEGLSGFRRIGSGGFSTVYAAWEGAFSRWVAVKVLDQLDETAARRFARERTLMGQSSGHPNVITPIRFGFTNAGQPYLVMQYLEGGSLQDAVDQGELIPWREAVALVRPIAEALGDSHEAGILHKDVKPANILLARNGTPSLTDFGIAGVRNSTVTQMSFTFAHSPPETFANGADLRDERSDLYSLASTLYTIVVGGPPFIRDRDDSQLALMNRIANHPVPPTGADPAFDQFLTWAMAKEPTQRPQSADQFVAGIDRVLAGGEPSSHNSAPTIIRSPAADPAPLPQPTEPRSHRRRTGMVGWAVAAIAVLGAGAAAWFAFARDTPDDQAIGVATQSSNESADPSTDPASPSTDPPSSETERTAEESGGDGSTAPAEVQDAKLLMQAGTAVATVVDGEVVLPSTSISAGGFTADNCESQLVGLQAAFGGPELSRLRDEIAEYPSGAPEGYDDPAGSDRGFQERLDAYVDQFESGYRTCIDVGQFTPVGPYVLGGWASIRSFVCVTGVVPTMTLADGTEQACPTADELDLCTRLLAPLLDDFFSAFPDRKPDPGSTCRAAASNDQGLLAELSAAA